MCVRRAQHRGVGGAGTLPHVVGEAPARGKQRRVLDALYRAPDETGRGSRGVGWGWHAIDDSGDDWGDGRRKRPRRQPRERRLLARSCSDPRGILVRRHGSGGYFSYTYTEGKFRDEAERLAAMSSYFGLCSFLDHNVGRVLKALADTGAMRTTTVVYTSDHGDNAGARGLWGKSNMYEESAAVPMIMAGAGVEPGACETPVSLVDLSETVIEHFGARLAGERPGRSLRAVASEAADSERAVFSEYHAAGAVSGAFMLRTGRWKYIYYVGFEPELFDLDADPEETTNLAAVPEYAVVVASLDARLRAICDPEAADARAHADQAAMIEAYGGREAALKLGAPGATPPPELQT